MSPSAARAVTVRRYAFALLLAAIAAAIQTRLIAFAPESILLVALPAIVAATWYGGTGPGALTAIATITTGVWLVATTGAAAGGGAVMVNGAIFVVTALLLAWTTTQLRRSARDERRRRVESDRACGEKTVLEAVARAVSAARTCSDVTTACATELMHAARAAAATVSRVSADGEVEIVQAFGYDESIRGRCSLSSNNKIAVAIRQRRVMCGVRGDLGATANGVDSVLARHEAFAIVPLAASTGALGAVTLGFDRPREIETGECECWLQAGQCVAQALERARLYDSAERARREGEAFRVRADAELLERRRAEEAHRESEARYRTLAARTQRLYSLSAALSEASTLDAVARAVVRHGRSVLGAGAGSVALCAEGDALETLYAEEYPPAVVEASKRFSAEPGMCTTAAIATRRPVLVGSFIELQAQYPRSAATAADGGFASAASLPLLIDNGPIGVLSFHFTVPVNFDPDYQALLTSVAQHAAQALDRARLYETSQRARVDAEAANHAKDDFLSIVSHELRTPLNAILGWGFMLREGTLDPARVERATEAIVKNATRQARLVDDLLDVSRIVAGRVTLDLQELEIADVIRGAVDAMLPVATQRGVELEVGVLPAARVKADPHRLEQAFSNLLTNALKFTPQGGRVTVDGAVDKGTVRVRVADTGCGIEPDVLPHIFERFRQGNNTTTRSVGGLGLGLFIVRRLIEALKGQVTVESAGRDAGAIFTVSLPVTAASAQPLSSADRADGRRIADPAKPDLSAVRVLVVDDEADTREMMSSALALYGAAVTTVSSTREALVKLEDTPYDVVLSDLAMPDEDGYELIRQIRTHPNSGIARVPAAAVTACARDDERQRALAAGFHVHLAKPIALGALLDTVTRLAGAAPART